MPVSEIIIHRKVYCPNCEMTIPPTAEVCPHCGETLEKQEK